LEQLETPARARLRTGRVLTRCEALHQALSDPERDRIIDQLLHRADAPVPGLWRRVARQV
jgi:hypothetical protein